MFAGQEGVSKKMQRAADAAHSDLQFCYSVGLISVRVAVLTWHASSVYAVMQNKLSVVTMNSTEH